jgi:hypothetical protein
MPNWPVGAENPVTASDQRFRDQPRPAPAAGTPASMIARCDFPTRVPLARPHAELAGATRPVNRDQGHRDLGAPSRGRRAAPTPPTTDVDLDRPRISQRAEQAPTHAAAPAAAGVSQNPCCAGTPDSSLVGGPTLDDNPAAHPRHNRSAPWYRWLGRTRPGASPRASSSDSVTRSPPPPSGRF